MTSEEINDTIDKLVGFLELKKKGVLLTDWSRLTLHNFLICDDELLTVSPSNLRNILEYYDIRKYKVDFTFQNDVMPKVLLMLDRDNITCFDEYIEKITGIVDKIHGWFLSDRINVTDKLVQLVFKPKNDILLNKIDVPFDLYFYFDKNKAIDIITSRGYFEVSSMYADKEKCISLMSEKDILFQINTCVVINNNSIFLKKEDKETYYTNTPIIYFHPKIIKENE